MNNNFFEEVYNNPYHISRNNKSQLYVDNYNKYIKNSNKNNNGKKLLSNIFINNGNYLSNSYNRIYNVFKNNNIDENNNLSKSVDLKSNKRLSDDEINNTNNNNYNNNINNNFNKNNNVSNTININIINNNNINNDNNNLNEHTIPLIKQYYNNNNYNNNERNQIYSYINSNKNPEDSYNSYNKYYSRNLNNNLRIKNLRKNFYNTSEYLYEYVPYDPNYYNVIKTRDYKRYDKPITIERDLDRYNIPEFPYDKNFAHKYFNSFSNTNRYINKNNTINNNNDDNIYDIKNNPTIKNSSILNKATMKSDGSEEMYIGIIEGQGKNAIKKNDIIDTYIDGAESEIQTKVK